jgi:hypothetical protein
MMWFEAVYVAVGLVVLIIGEASLNCWDVEQATVWMLLFCNHVDQMVLHYAMGSSDKFSDASSHTGSPLTSKMATLAVCILLFVVTLFGWIYVGVSVWSTDHWSDFSNAGAFAFWHDMLTLRYVHYFIYGSCALVQIIKIVDFLKHNKNAKDNENLTRMQRMLPLINIVISAIALVFIIIVISSLSRYA